jgi:murein L,D-transpeptidase YafK
VGAFPVNYPNELDRRNGKTGYGIWLHGTDKGSYSRPPRDSEGCVVLTNIDLESLKSEIKPGITPVVITNKVEWIDHASWEKERQEIIQAVENWRVDWESMNVNKYLSHYGKEFWSASHNLKSWSARKRRLAKSKTYQKVKFSDLSVLVYPKKEQDKNQIAVVRLQQDYRSNNFNSEMYKRLYLTKKDQSWKILYEGR